MALLFYSITKIDILEALDFPGIVPSMEIVKINRMWSFQVLRYMNSLTLP